MRVHVRMLHVRMLHGGSEMSQTRDTAPSRAGATTTNDYTISALQLMTREEGDTVTRHASTSSDTELLAKCRQMEKRDE